MTRHADIFVDIPAHIASGRFIQDVSTNKHDIRDFTFSDVDLRGCKNILDLGCSYGFFTRGLAGRLHPDAHVTGVELWPRCEEYFLAACGDSGFSGQFVVSDKVFCKRFADKSFDLVLCSYALYFFPEAIADIARVLRSDGLFVTVTHTVPHMQELVGIFKKLLVKHKGIPVQILPLEKLFAAFSNANGQKMLLPWFQEVREKEYANALRIDEASLPSLINYLCFKRPKFIPGEYKLDEQFIRSDVADNVRELLTRQGALMISKDDTVYICQYPLVERSREI